jgi:cytoskeletal protein RodZ
MFDKLSSELREQREKAGISLQQLANKTRIDQKFLEAIDQGNFAFLPDLYVKAFVKQYARTVGLDENLIIKKYEAAKEGKEYDPNKVDEEKIEEKPKVENEAPVKPPVASPKPATYFENPLEQKPTGQRKPRKQNLIWMIAGSVAVLAVILIYLIVGNKSDKIVVEETPIEDVVGQQSQRYQENNAETSQPDSQVVQSSADSLHLTVFAKETSWVYVVLDGKTSKEFTLYPNSKLSLSALNNFQGTIGNSGGVSMQLDNQPVDFTGRSGAIRYFKLDKSGLVYLNTPPKIENP